MVFAKSDLHISNIILALFCILVFPHNSNAAETKIKIKPEKIDLKKNQLDRNAIQKIFPGQVPIEQTEAALSLPFKNRIQTIMNQGPKGYKNLRTIAFNKRASMEARWRSIISMARIGGPLAMPEIERSLVDSQWFVRSAGLYALARVDRAKAKIWASQFLDNDQSLLVRVAATKVLKRIKDKSTLGILWQKLHSKENFHRGKSLFIRPKIVEALSQIASPAQSFRFIQLLDDKDDEVRTASVKALESIHRIKLGKTDEPSTFKASYWKKWYETNKSTL